ncbi:sensor histidine kinase [Granulicoccus sp. GXG6511]|uniref:sensor histidine kinase n=1 Tax=Granulicoccus sp. GXG6511 TaxID=3381351 RepID=UPI003D7D8367
MRNLLQNIRRSVRWRIVAWMILTMAVSFAVVVISVRGLLLTDLANRANHDVNQEINEFYSFASEGVEPGTGQPFTSTARLFEVHLSRQRAGDLELLLGHLPAYASAYEQRGTHVPAYETYDALADETLMTAIDNQQSGIHESSVGQIRWGKADVEVNGRVDGTLIVLHFTGVEEARVADTVRVLTLVALVAMFVSVLIAFLAAGQILQPLRLLHRTAREVSHRDLTTRIPVHGSDEVSQLARTFNSMLDRLEGAFNTQQRFVDDAGHELRTPITAIRGHLELLHTKTPEQQTQTIALLTGELDRMGRIVNDLLALAKADQPDFVQPRETDIAELTLHLDALAQALADRRWMLTRIADGPAVLDEQRITQAVLQLLQNAVQHTEAGDEIRLSSDFIDIGGVPYVQFTVTDTGPGVPEAEREHIFERFARGASPGTAETGAGLGLAIVSAIARGHGGMVTVGGTPGSGAIFSITVPVGDTAEQPAEDPEQTVLPAGQPTPADPGDDAAVHVDPEQTARYTPAERATP